MNQWIDSHLHLTDPRIYEKADEYIVEAQSRDICFFMLGGVDPEDWERQLILKKKYPDNIGTCFGLHPYFVAEHDEDECNAALDQLAHKMKDCLAVGETGLDFRPNIMKESRTLQIDMFAQQLEIADLADKPVVLHIVQAFDEAIRVIDLFGAPKRKGMVHAFNGSFGKAQEFITRGFALSIGGALLKSNGNKHNERLYQVIQQMPLEFLLLESDSPDQAPDMVRYPDYKAGNRPVSIFDVAQKVAEIRQMDVFEVLKTNTSNFKRIFQI